MNKITTLGEFRAFLKTQDGQIDIGGLTIRGSNNTDIDIKYKGELITWLASGHSDTDTLADIHTTIIDSFNNNTNKSLESEVNAKQNVINELEKVITDLKNEANENQLASGKVQAYEKLLIGRDITISK